MYLQPVRAARFPVPSISARVTLIVVLLLGLFLVGETQPGGVAQPSVSGAVGLAKLPLTFVPDLDQTHAQVRMDAHGLGGTLAFMAGEVALALPGQKNQDTPGGAESRDTLLRVHFLGAEPRAPNGDKPLPGVVNSYTGSDPARWRIGVPTYGGLIYHQIYPGIDLHYDGAGGRLKGTYVLAPGADPARIRWSYTGADSVRIDTAGSVVVTLPGAKGTISEAAPVAWQTIANRQVPVAVHYTRAADGSIGFALGAFAQAYPLTIDPTLTYSTYLGGSDYDAGTGIVVDASGNTYITGDTYSPDFPGAGNSRSGHDDVFVARLNAQGTGLAWSTYLGGTGSDQGNAIAIDGAGNAWVTGKSDSTNFPTTVDALQKTFGGTNDGIVAKLDGARGSLVYSTYFGGANQDEGDGVTVDQNGNAYVAGAYQDPSYQVKVIVLKFAAQTNALAYGATFGGSGEATGRAIAVDGAGNAYITGKTTPFGSTNDFPMVNPIQASCGIGDSYGNCSDDAFVTKLSADGKYLLYSTYLGGRGVDAGRGIAVDGSGNILIAGNTTSPDFPTAHAVQAVCPDGVDPDLNLCNNGEAFVTKLAPQGGSYVYSTYLGGLRTDGARGLAVDTAGNAYVVGYTQSDNFPVVDAVQSSRGGGVCIVGGTERLCADAFVTKFTPNGSISYSTYLGGDGEDYGSAIAVDASGNAYITGDTKTFDFPTSPGALQTTKNLQEDAFVAKIASGTGAPVGRFKLYLPLVRR